MKKLLLPILAVFLLGLTACSTAETDSTRSTSETTTQSSHQDETGATTNIVVTIDGTDYPATLENSQATQSLLEKLPLELSFRDYAVGFDEKIADLGQPLDYGDEDYDDDPEALDIGYWSPDERLVFYYGNVGAYSGIHVIGQFDDEAVLEVPENLTESSQVSIRLAE